MLRMTAQRCGAFGRFRNCGRMAADRDFGLPNRACGSELRNLHWVRAGPIVIGNSPERSDLMHLRSSRGFLLVIWAALAVPACAGHPKACATADEASRLVNKDVCISAHVYEVVQLPDGTRFLDVCTPETPDDRCRFTIVSFWEDRDEVGELSKYRDMDVQVRGIIHPMHGRAGMVLSHARQFYGGPPKFKPNPRLARGFGGEQEHPPIADPNLRSQGGRRAFMNTKDREALPPR
jgi:hypothetical protein